MADTLRIKRRLAGGAAGAPSALAAAELAFNEQDNTLWYGKGNSGGNATSIISVGGSGAFLPLSGGTLTGQTIVSYASGAYQFAISPPSGLAISRFGYVTGQGAITETVNTTTNQTRWKWWWGNGNETGSNVGSDFLLQRFDDTGAVFSGNSPLTITRATGLATFGSGISLSSQLGGSVTDLSKHIALYGTAWGFGVTSGQINVVANSASVAS